MIYENTDDVEADSTVPSNMVSTGGLIRPGYDKTQSAIVLQLQTQPRFSLGKWRPRSGRTKAFAQWSTTLKRVAEYLQVDLDNYLDEAPPAFPSTPRGTPRD